MGGDAIDFEAEGLLEGLEGDAREARLELLGELAAGGAEVEELRRAVAERRLALLPVERVLSGGGARYTSDEVAKRAGVDREFLDRQWRALGMAIPDERQPAFTEQDVEAARRTAALREAGLPDDGIIEIARLMGMTMAQLAAANRSLIVEVFMGEGDSEHDVATRFANAARAFSPMISDSLTYVFNLHLREQIAHDVLDAADLATGRLPASQEVTVAFADMVGFTRLGEKLAPEELGEVTGRLAELAAAAVEPPARLVKLIGDAAMFAGPAPEGVVEAALRLVEAAESEGEGFGVMRAGVAAGEALARGGDWYGHPVNLASRIAARARPESVLVSKEVRDALGDSYRWSNAGAKRLKGIQGEVRLFRCRRLGDDPDGA